MATAVRNCIEARESWSGLVSDLYETLSMTMSPEVRRSGDWPGNARWFSDRLRRAAPDAPCLASMSSSGAAATGVHVNISKIAALATLATSEPGRNRMPGVTLV